MDIDLVRNSRLNFIRFIFRDHSDIDDEEFAIWNNAACSELKAIFDQFISKVSLISSKIKDYDLGDIECSINIDDENKWTIHIDFDLGTDEEESFYGDLTSDLQVINVR
jgi:hypothetical protein